MPVIEAHERLTRESRECLGVLVETALVLDEWREQSCLIGGWAAYAFIETFLHGRDQVPLRHRGSLDVDVAWGLGELTPDDAGRIVQRLEAAGYRRLGDYTWAREGHTTDLMAVPPPDHREGLLHVGAQSFAPFWNGHVALRSPQVLSIRAERPNGELATAEVRVASVAGLLFAKMFAAPRSGRRLTQERRYKDHYDVFALVRTYPAGAEALAENLRENLTPQELAEFTTRLAGAFEEWGSIGPRAVAIVRLPEAAGDEEYVRNQHVAEAHVTMDLLLRALREAG